MVDMNDVSFDLTENSGEKERGFLHRYHSLASRRE